MQILPHISAKLLEWNSFPTIFVVQIGGMGWDGEDYGSMVHNTPFLGLRRKFHLYLPKRKDLKLQYS